jgi:hypothetical protein
MESKVPVIGDATTVLRSPFRALAMASAAAKHVFAHFVRRYAQLVGNRDPHCQVAWVRLGDNVVAADPLTGPDLDLRVLR